MTLDQLFKLALLGTLVAILVCMEFEYRRSLREAAATRAASREGREQGLVDANQRNREAHECGAQSELDSTAADAKPREVA